MDGDRAKTGLNSRFRLCNGNGFMVLCKNRVELCFVHLRRVIVTFFFEFEIKLFLVSVFFGGSIDMLKAVVLPKVQDYRSPLQMISIPL